VETVTDLAELFSRNPLELTNPDLDAIITEMRGMRHAFNAGNMKAGTTKKKEKDVDSIVDKLDLKGIDL
jgi:hypothetical protein